MWPSLCIPFTRKSICLSYQKKKKNTHLRHYHRQEVPQRFLPLKLADQHTSTHTTHQGSAGRWEEHRGERDGRSLARPLSPHHPASPSQQERALNQRSKREEGSEGREREERRREGRKRQMQNELMRGSRGSRVLKRSHEMHVFTIFLPCVPGCILFLCQLFFCISLHKNHTSLSWKFCSPSWHSWVCMSQCHWIF